MQPSPRTLLPRWKVLLLPPVVVLTSCAALLTGFEGVLEGLATLLGPGQPVAVVPVEAPEVRGTGAVVGPTTVLTVAHVVGGSDRAWVRTGPRSGLLEARVRARLPARPEPIVVLEVAAREGPLAAVFGFTGFSPEQVFCLSRAAGAPALVYTRRGLASWVSYRPEPGDSGSPVLSPEGHLVGLVSGLQGLGVAVVPVSAATLSACGLDPAAQPQPVPIVEP